MYLDIASVAGFEWKCCLCCFFKSTPLTHELDCSSIEVQPSTYKMMIITVIRFFGEHFHIFLLKLNSVIMWLLLNTEEWKNTVSPVLQTAILSVTLDTQGEKTLFPLARYQTQSPLSVSVTGKSGPLRHTHSSTPHSSHRVWEAGGSIQRPWEEPQGWSSAPCGTANSNLPGWNLHRLVQTHLSFPRQCHLIDSSCVGGLGAVYTECQASARQLSVSAQVAEWVGRDWGWTGGSLGQSAASGIREPHLACRILAT